MRIAFADFCRDFHAASVDIIPLGGAQSVVCHLARALAHQGHEITLISHLSTPGVYDGVACTNWKEATADKIRSWGLDALVAVLVAGDGSTLRPVLGNSTRLILWNHHATDEAGVQPLLRQNERDAYDGFVMVSNWQRDQYLRAFGLDASKTVVLRNAVGTPFLNQFPDAAPILAQKSRPPVLAYTSTPFRGLDILLDAFPFIRAAVPDARLRVFSSMRVYAYSPQEDENSFRAFYEGCRRTPGVEYVGSIPQPQLAAALRDVTVLAYPNTFPETSCLAAMEAMACGCRVVTSDRAALPETTAGFARLIPGLVAPRAFLAQFVEQSVLALRECLAGGPEIETLLRRQVDLVNANAAWPGRAREWIAWLRTLSPRT